MKPLLLTSLLLSLFTWDKSFAEPIKPKPIDYSNYSNKPLTEKYRRIYNNCVVDKLPAHPSEMLQNAVQEVCNDKANNPSFWDKLRYDGWGD